MRRLTLLLALGACVGVPREAPLSPQALSRWVVETHDASRAFIPPASYRVWWTELVDACGCRPAVGFDDLQFYALRGNTFPCARTARCYGAYVGDGVQAIFLADLWQADERTVKHELLHAVLGVSWHPLLFRQLGLSDPGER